MMMTYLRYVVKHMLRMRGAPLPQKATHEANKAEVEWIVIKSQLSDNGGEVNG